jgi:hypothetical protein
MIWSDSKIKSDTAQVSAVLHNSRGFSNVKYAEGVMVRCRRGGLMYEASVGGQQFKFTKL